MRTPVYSARFKKDYKLCQKRGCTMSKLLAVMSDLEKEVQLSIKGTSNKSVNFLLV